MAKTIINQNLIRATAAAAAAANTAGKMVVRTGRPPSAPPRSGYTALSRPSRAGAALGVRYSPGGGAAADAISKGEAQRARDARAGARHLPEQFREAYVRTATRNTNADTVNNWTNGEVAIGALLGTVATYREFDVALTSKTGSPGNAYIVATISYRIVAT